MQDLRLYREEIDAIDDQIVELIAARMAIIHRVAAYKKQKSIAAILPDRVAEVRERNAERGAAHGIDAEFMRALYTLIIDHSCKTEQALMDGS